MDIKDLIIKYKIKQVHFCRFTKEIFKKKIISEYKLSPYKNKNKPVIFLGCNYDSDRLLINYHKSTGIVLWFNEQLNGKKSKSSKNKVFLDEIKNKKNLIHFLITNIENLSIKSLYSGIQQIDITNSNNNLFNLNKYFKNTKQKFFIYYSKLKYHLLFQRPHQIMTFMNKQKYNKIFIGNTDKIIFEEKNNLLVVPYEVKDSIYNSIHCTNIVTYFTDSRLIDEIEKLPGEKLYDLIDAPIDEFKIWKPNLEKSVTKSDFVMYSHPKLVKYLKEIDENKNYHYISNACDYEYFSKAKKRIGSRPSEFPKTDKPILGFYGAFAQWLDYNLIRKYADEGIYHVVMIGGIPNIRTYNQRFNHSNITWIDHKPYDKLSYYLSWFDKCLLPFKDCELNKYVNPCKLWEYMASEKELIIHNININHEVIVKYTEICDIIDLILTSKKYKNIIINDNSTTFNLLKQRPQNIMENIESEKTLSLYVDRNNDFILKDMTDNFKIISTNIFLYIIKNNIKLGNNFTYFFCNTEKYIYANQNIFDNVIFDLMDNPTDEFSFWKKNLLKCFEISDYISYVAPHLEKVIREYTSKPIIYLKNGVNFKKFNSIINNIKIKKPKIFNNIKLPILLYYGAHTTWYDFELVKKIADLNKVHIISIGGIKTCKSYDMQIKHKNITWINHMEQSELFSFLKYANFCFIPFKLTEMMKGCDPLKYYEFLSAGKIVLTTEISAIRNNSFTYYINHNNYNQVIDEVLNENKISRNNKIKEGIQFSQKNDWKELSSKLIDLKKNIKIALIGYINFGNFGDDLFKYIYETNFKNCQFDILYKPQKPYFDETFKEKIKEYDAILLAGGDLIMPYSYSDLYFNKCLIDSNLPIFINNISVATFDELTGVKTENKNILDKYSNFFSNKNIKLINFRDQISLNYFKDRISYNNEIILNSFVDMAFSLNLSDNKKGIKNNKKALIIIRSNIKNDYSNYKKLITKLENENYEYDILSLALYGNEYTNEIKISNYLNNKEIIFLPSIKEIIEKIGEYDIIFSSRFHGYIIGLLYEKICFSLSNNNKFTSLNKILNIENNNIKDINLIDFKNINKYICNSTILNKNIENANIMIDKLKDEIVKYCLKITHYGSYYLENNDIVKQFTEVLEDICINTNIIDLKIYKNEDNIIVHKNNGNKIREIQKNNLTTNNVKDSNTIIVNSGNLFLSSKLQTLLQQKTLINNQFSDPDVYPLMEKYINQYDIIYSNSLKALRENYPNINKHHLLMSANSKYFKKITNIEERENIIGIIGEYRLDRKDYVLNLLNSEKIKSGNYKLEIYGKNWNKINLNSKFVSNQDLVYAYNKVKIYISFGKTLSGYNNIKIGLFEAISCGCLVLTDSEEIRKYFDETEVIYFKDIKDFINKINFITNNPELIKKYSTNARESFLKKYRFEKCVKDIIKKIL